MKDQNATISKKELRKVSRNETRPLLIPRTPMQLLPKNLNAEAKGKRVEITDFLLKPGPSVKKKKKMTCRQKHLETLTLGGKKTHIFLFVGFILKLVVR